MAQLRQKVIRALQQQLDDFQDALEDLPGGRISGVVVSSSFDSMDHQSRQEKLSRILHRALTKQEISSLGAIAALTPAEANVHAM